VSISDRSSAGVVPGAGRAAPHVPLIAFVYLAIIVLTWAGNWPLMKLALGQVTVIHGDKLIGVFDRLRTLTGLPMQIAVLASVALAVSRKLEFR